MCWIAVSVPSRFAASTMCWCVRGRATDRSKHLWPLQHQLHRTVHHLGRHRRQHHVRPRGTLATKSTAGKWTEHAHVVVREPQSVCATVCFTPEMYCVASCSVSFSPSHCAIVACGSIGIVVLHRRLVHLIDLNLRRSYTCG